MNEQEREEETLEEAESEAPADSDKPVPKKRGRKPIDKSSPYRNLHGKEVFLTGKNMVWSLGQKVQLSLIPDDSGKNNPRGFLPKDLSPLEERFVEESIKKGVIDLTSEYSKEEIERMTTVVVEETNSPALVEDLTLYDQLLAMDLTALEKELGHQQKENKRPKEFFRNLLSEEKYSKKRPQYIELIEKFL